MSRGPGRWQRAILEAVADCGSVPIPLLVGAETATWPPPRSALLAAQRAARVLEAAGRVDLISIPMCSNCGEVPRGDATFRCRRCNSYFVYHRAGAGTVIRRRGDRLSVVKRHERLTSLRDLMQRRVRAARMRPAEE